MPFNVLIVDDSLTSRGMIRRILKMTDLPWGEIHEAENGRAGLESMRRNWVDLVMADLSMPLMNGEEMIAAMRADPLLRELPVIVVSAEGSATLIEALVEKGVRHVVRKPFEPVHLKRMVEEALGVKKNGA